MDWVGAWGFVAVGALVGGFVVWLVMANRYDKLKTKTDNIIDALCQQLDRMTAVRKPRPVFRVVGDQDIRKD